jgi:biopolymer transport protein ExbD
MLISMSDVGYLAAHLFADSLEFCQPNRAADQATRLFHSGQAELPNAVDYYYSDDRLFLSEQPVIMSELPQKLQQQYQSSEQVVRIATESSVPVQKLINLMGIIRAAGFERIFVATGEKTEK